MIIKKYLILILLLLSSVNIIGEESVCIETISEELSKQRLLEVLIEENFQDPHAMYRIALWETGHLKFIKNNNLFGLRSNTYLSFDSWYDCILYMKTLEDKKWLKYSKTNRVKDYYDFIHWWGYKDGVSRSEENLKYIENIKSIKLDK